MKWHSFCDVDNFVSTKIKKSISVERSSLPHYAAQAWMGLRWLKFFDQI